MSWYKKHLITGEEGKTISTISDLFTLIEEVYEVEKGRFFGPKKTEIELLKEQFLNERKSLTLTLDAIPEIDVTELGWTDVTGDGAQAVSGPERQKLLQFLEHIHGEDFVEKIASIARFYEDPDSAMQEMFGEAQDTSTAKQIATALSYLVFYKTLTKIIANFNAASAGFSFEAFLAVLMNGKQIAANTGTIADFISMADGTKMPVSLKLYQEGGLHVGGSFRDLVGDLRNPQFEHDLMRYVAVTKKFEGGQKEGQNVNGELKWYRFDFTLDNLFDILSKSSKHSKSCIRLPKTYAEAGQDFASALPGIADPSPQEMEQVYIVAFKKELEVLNQRNPDEYHIDDEFANKFLENLSWSSQLSDKFFKEYDPNIEASEEERADPDYEKRPSYVKRGTSIMPRSAALKKEMSQIVQGTMAQFNEGDEPRYNLQDKEIIKLANQIGQCAREANNGDPKYTAYPKLSVVKQFSASEDAKKRTAILKQKKHWLSPEESTIWYNNLGDNSEAKKEALLQTYGFLSTEQFGLTQVMVGEIHTYSENHRVLGPNQSEAEFGIIHVGRQNTQKMLNRMTSILNESLFEIFTNVKAVQENTYAYVAGGMTKDGLADQAIVASSNIISKTTELKSTKDQKTP